MEGLTAALGALAGGVAGGVLGFLAGDRLVGGRGWLYWTANALFVASGVALASVGLLKDLTWVWYGGIALLGGSVTGLKYGHGRNPGARILRDGVGRAR